MGLNIRRDRLCLLQISDGRGDVHLVHFDGKDYSAPHLKSIISDQSRKIIFHFARFDMAIIYHYLGVMVENVFCTKIASKIARTYTSSHGLKDLCKELLGVTLSKQQQSSYWGEKNLTNEQKEYAAADVLYLHALREKLHSMLVSENRIDLAKHSFSFIKTRVLLDINGWSDIDIFEH